MNQTKKIKSTRDKIPLAQFRKFCDKYIASYELLEDNLEIGVKVAPKNELPTKFGFHFQINQVFGIKAATLRKWKQDYNAKWECVEDVYEYIKMRLEKEWINGADKNKSDQASKYYSVVFNAGNTDREERAETPTLNIVLKGKNPFEGEDEEE